MPLIPIRSARVRFTEPTAVHSNLRSFSVSPDKKEDPDATDRNTEGEPWPLSPAGGDSDTVEIDHEQEVGSPVDKTWAQWFSGRGGDFGVLDGWLELRSKIGDDGHKSATKLLLNHGLPPGQRRCGVRGFGCGVWG